MNQCAITKNILGQGDREDCSSPAQVLFSMLTCTVHWGLCWNQVWGRVFGLNSVEALSIRLQELGWMKSTLSLVRGWLKAFCRTNPSPAPLGAWVIDHWFTDVLAVGWEDDVDRNGSMIVVLVSLGPYCLVGMRMMEGWVDDISCHRILIAIVYDNGIRV